MRHRVIPSSQLVKVHFTTVIDDDFGLESSSRSLKCPVRAGEPGIENISPAGMRVCRTDAASAPSRGRWGPESATTLTPAPRTAPDANHEESAGHDRDI